MILIKKIRLPTIKSFFSHISKCKGINEIFNLKLITSKYLNKLYFAFRAIFQTIILHDLISHFLFKKNWIIVYLLLPTEWKIAKFQLQLMFNDVRREGIKISNIQFIFYVPQGISTLFNSSNFFLLFLLATWTNRN